MLSVTSSLNVDYTAQLSHFVYDLPSDSLFLVGARNLDAPQYMAGAVLSRSTVYAGCATLLPVSGWVPLPQRTGIPKYDQLPLTYR